MDERLRELEREAIASEDPDTAYRWLLEQERLGFFKVTDLSYNYPPSWTQHKVLTINFNDSKLTGTIFVKVSDKLIVSSPGFAVDRMRSQFSDVYFHFVDKQVKFDQAFSVRTYNELGQRLKNGLRAKEARRAAIAGIEIALKQNIDEISEAFDSYRKAQLHRSIYILKRDLTQCEKRIANIRSGLGSAVIDFLKLGGDLGASKPD